MKNRKILVISFFLTIILLPSCTPDKEEFQNRVVIGVVSDVQSFNPLYSFSVNEGTVTEQLFVSLIDFRWDEQRGDLESRPMLAKKWEWAEDSSSIKFLLRDDVYWSDGERLTADDVIFSYDVFSDPKVESMLYGFFRNFYTDDENHIDIEKSFKIISTFEFIIYFSGDAVPNLYEVTMPVVPEHILNKIPREEIKACEFNFHPVTSGAFKLKKWNKNQTIVLEKNAESFLQPENGIDELVFKIIPDYTARFLELQKGGIDLMELIKAEDIQTIKEIDELKIVPVIGREYDYIGWNNIDISLFTDNGKIVPHKLFGSKNVRRALTHAINRQEILDEYLLGYGELAVTPVSPIFKNVINNTLQPYEYNPKKARELLSEEGWRDTDNDGTLEKGETEFEFTLVYPSGNPLRSYSSTIVQNNLKAVGIDMNIETMELGTFIDNLFEKKMDAWMAAWYIPIPLELKSYWYSDLQSTPLNFASYRSSAADKIMDKLNGKINDKYRKELLLEFQSILHDDEPVTFLYWTPNIAVYNKKIENININPLGVVTHCWEWTVKN